MSSPSSLRLQSPLPLAGVFVCGLVGVALAWLNQGLQIVGPDQQLYIPFIKHAANPALYPGDLVFDNVNAHATAFIPAMAAIQRLTGLDLRTLQLAGELLALFAWFSGLAAVAARIGGRGAALWCVVFASWALPVPGCACDLWGTAFHPRTVAQACALWALWLVLGGRGFVAGLLVGGSFLVHPLMAVSAIAALAFAATATSRRLALNVVAGAAVTLALSRLVWHGQSVHLPLRPTEWWLRVASGGYLWAQHWSHATSAAFVAWSALAAYVMLRAHRSLGARVEPIIRFGAAALPFVLVAFAGMAARSPLFVSLQLHRAMYLPVYAAIVLLGALFAAAVDEGRLRPSLAAAAALVVFSQSFFVILPVLAAVLVLERVAVPARAQQALALVVVAVVLVHPAPHRLALDGVQAQRPDPSWLATQQWAHDHTPPTARFAVPLDMPPDFRVYSERPVVWGIQDAAPAIFSEPLARRQVEVVPLNNAWAHQDCAEVGRLARALGADFAVLTWSCGGPSPAVTLGPYRVYDLTRGNLSPP